MPKKTTQYKAIRIDRGNKTSQRIAKIKDYLRDISGTETITDKRAIEFAINMAIDMIEAERAINE